MNEYRVTWKVYRSWACENMLKGPRLVMAVIWCLMAVGFIVLGIVNDLNLDILCFWMAVFCIYRAFFRVFVLAKGQYRMLAKTYGGENWTRRIAFEEDGISLTEGNASVRYAYSDIVNIREKGNKIWLDAANKTVLRLYRDAFVESGWEECRHKLDEMAKARLNG